MGHLPVFERDQFAKRIIESLVAKPMWSQEALAVFHADPHGGNLLRADDGRLAILDWSLLTRLDKEERSQLVRIVLSALSLDQEAICLALDTLSV